VRIEDDELLRKLDTALRHLQKTGRLDAIANQWLDR
jgi:ABC-type amino acid transport substrate-binding protein